MEKNFKIVVPSVGRSDYSILRNLILEAQKNRKYNSHVVSIGSHNSKLFGDTVNLFNKDKIKQKEFIKIKYLKNNKNNTILYFSKILLEIDRILKKLKPHVCIIMGDRYEMLATAITCKNLNIKIVHLCGGSTTEGSHDNDYRYCISRLSDFHFVETKQHKKALLNNDIKNNRILVSGAPALENLDNKKYKGKDILFNELNIPAANQRIIVFTYHPETTKTLNHNLNNLKISLNLLKYLIKKNYFIIITYPNADHGFNKIIDLIKKFDNENLNCKSFKSLGSNNYYNLLKYTNIVIGNSSSGIIECASFKLPVINCGERQKGRYCSWNVLHSQFKLNSLIKNIKIAESKTFKKKLLKLKNPYSIKIDSKKILQIVSKFYS